MDEDKVAKVREAFDQFERDMAELAPETRKAIKDAFAHAERDRRIAEAGHDVSKMTPEHRKAIELAYTYDPDDPDPEDKLGLKALERFKRRVTFVVYLALWIGIPWVVLHFILKYW